MINIQKSYFKIWEVEDKGKFVKAKASTSKKDKQTDTWVNSNWNVRFVGKCIDEAKTLEVGDRIVATNGIIENVWDKEKKMAWLNVIIFEFEKQEENSHEVPTTIEDDDELPF